MFARIEARNHQTDLRSRLAGLIEAALRELRYVGLVDALRVLVGFAECRDARYERAAGRFAARVMMERRWVWPRPYVLALAEALAPRRPLASHPRDRWSVRPNDVSHQR